MLLPWWRVGLEAWYCNKCFLGYLLASLSDKARCACTQSRRKTVRLEVSAKGWYRCNRLDGKSLLTDSSKRNEARLKFETRWEEMSRGRCSMRRSRAPGIDGAKCPFTSIASNSASWGCRVGRRPTCPRCRALIRERLRSRYSRRSSNNNHD